MDEKKKKQYMIFGGIFAVAFIIIVALPSPNSKSGIALPPPVSPGVSTVQPVTESLKTSENEEVVIVEEYFNRKVKRDIFINPLMARPTEQNVVESPVAEPPKAEKKFKVTGVMITDKRKSATLDDGRIVNEKDIVDDYIVSKVGRDEVIFIGREGKDVKRVKVWGDEE